MLLFGTVAMLVEMTGEFNYTFDIFSKFLFKLNFFRWLVDDVNDFTFNETISYPLTKLEPYTQYAYYVKAYTLSTEKTGAQSQIAYFRTLPGQPHAVSKFKSTAKSSSAIVNFASSLIVTD